MQPGKCFFARRGIEFCGFWVDEEGVRTEKGKVDAVRDWPVPTSAKHIKEFLGLTGLYRKFIDHYAPIAMPLYVASNATKSDVSWTSECDHAFQTLKKTVTQAPVLGIPDKAGRWRLRTDASKFAMGAVLMQQDEEGMDEVIAYFSRKLKDVETRYHTYDREL